MSRQRRARRPKSVRFSLRDFEDLETLLKSKPAEVLSWFQREGIGSLAELEMYQRLRVEQPAVAARIALVAVSLGVPVDAWT